MGVYGALESAMGQMVGIPALGHFCTYGQNPEVESSLDSNTETGTKRNREKNESDRERRERQGEMGREIEREREKEREKGVFQLQCQPQTKDIRGIMPSCIRLAL